MSTGEAQIGVNTNLQKQDLSNLDVSNLTPLSQEVISRQATINIGTIGHVAHGKSTVVKAISGVQTVRFKNELERNITIKLERISHERILDLINSPKLLKEFEKREAAKLKRIQTKNSNYLRTHTQSRKPNDKTPPPPPCPPSPSPTQLRPPPPKTSRRSHSLESVVTDYTSRSNSHLSASSPTSGYESLNESTANNLHKHLLNNTDKGKLSKENSKPSDGGTPTHKRHKVYVEYVVEKILSLESIKSHPVFYVKWLNYPDEQNTWETFENLSECKLLDPFIEELYTLHEETIGKIVRESQPFVNMQAVEEVDMKLVDAYEPLLLKTDLILLAQFRNARNRSVRQPELIRRRVVSAMRMESLYQQRQKQLQELRNFESRMNSVEHSAPLKIENNVDFDVIDANFQYVLESFPGKNVNICNVAPIGCQCAGKCTPLSKCCARMADNYFAYDKNGRLRIQPGAAIFECNSVCLCDKNCVNRVIQRGRMNSLCLFKTSTGCGWGVRTEKLMRKGEFVCEYVGEIITSEEANERGKTYDAIGRTYLFDLDYNTAAESVYTIDAAVYGNVSHFINHSCDPNLAVFPFWINNLDINMPRLGFFTLRHIKEGEELTFDYMRMDYQNLSEAQKVTCRCGASNCRKVLF